MRLWQMSLSSLPGGRGLLLLLIPAHLLSAGRGNIPPAVCSFWVCYLQHLSDPLTSPHIVHRAGASGAAGSLQQPGEPFARLHLGHFSAFSSQHASEPLTWPQLVHNLSFGHEPSHLPDSHPSPPLHWPLSQVPLPLQFLPFSFAHPAAIKAKVIVKRAEIVSNRFICSSLSLLIPVGRTVHPAISLRWPITIVGIIKTDGGSKRFQRL